MKQVGHGAFACCVNLKCVILNDGLKALGKSEDEHDDEMGVFQYSAVYDLMLPSTVTDLGKNAFKNSN